jgi:hypothetical protein
MGFFLGRLEFIPLGRGQPDENHYQAPPLLPTAGYMAMGG